MRQRRYKKTLYNNVYSTYCPPNKGSTLQPSSQWALNGLGVYRFVFTTNVAFGAALLLCLSLLLQPVASAYAQEIPAPETENVDVEIDTSSPPSIEPLPPDEAQSSSELELGQVTPDVIDNGDDELDLPLIDGDQSESSPASDTTETDGATDATTVDDTSADTLADSLVTPDTPADDVTSASSTESEVVVNDIDSAVDSADVSTTSPATLENDQDMSGSPTTSDITSDAEVDSAAPTTSAETIFVSNVQTDNQFSFNKNECTEVEDGSFYCQKISYDTLQENDLFAAPDATGDLEIFVIQDGVEMKITDNTVDDASPYYDSGSNTLVWHRLINDRYQIISYDIASGKEQQITDTSVNNMEPTRNGQYTVWQRWVQNNWEIILDDGSGEEQLTSSIEHDIAPHIRGDLIIWNVRASDGSQSLMTYDISSKIFNEIKDADGVSVANPRMLVMYEAQYQNGDTIMKGFDLLTGEIIPIDSIPRELPADIPNPETTGEVRALPTNPHSEEELVSDTDLDTDEPDNGEPLYEQGDLVLTATSTATSTAQPAVAEFDLDLRPIDDSATTTADAIVDQAAIPDIVIPAFDEIELVEQASSTQDT